MIGYHFNRIKLLDLHYTLFELCLKSAGHGLFIQTRKHTILLST